MRRAVQTIPRAQLRRRLAASKKKGLSSRQIWRRWKIEKIETSSERFSGSRLRTRKKLGRAEGRGRELADGRAAKGRLENKLDASLGKRATELYRLGPVPVAEKKYVFARERSPHVAAFFSIGEGSCS